MQRTSIAFAAFFALGLAGCAWVELTDAGQGVHVGTPIEVASCERLGATHATTRENAGIFTRRDRKVDQELEFLARNEAAEMGGNTIVPLGPTVKGRRSYEVFRCGVR